MEGPGLLIFFFLISVTCPSRNMAFLMSPLRLNLPRPGRPGFKPLRGPKERYGGTGTADFFLMSVTCPFRNIAFLMSPLRLNLPRPGRPDFKPLRGPKGRYGGTGTPDFLFSDQRDMPLPEHGVPYVPFAVEPSPSGPAGF